MTTRTNRLFLKIFALNFLLSLCMVSLEAHAQRRPVRPKPRPRPVRPVQPPIRPIAPIQQRIVLHNVNIHTRGVQRMALGQMVLRRKGINLRGKVIKQVNIVASSAAGRGAAHLLVNGRATDSVRGISYYGQRVNLFGGYRTPAHSLQLQLNGNIHVSQIAVIVESPYYRGGRRGGY